jgi:hypothetical protein
MGPEVEFALHCVACFCIGWVLGTLLFKLFG